LSCLEAIFAMKDFYDYEMNECIPHLVLFQFPFDVSQSVARETNDVAVSSRFLSISFAAFLNRLPEKRTMWLFRAVFCQFPLRRFSIGCPRNERCGCLLEPHFYKICFR
jgi:hypothetical protein